jgi:neurotransmitter:Na+ symporter, NSS family
MNRVSPSAPDPGEGRGTAEQWSSRTGFILAAIGSAVGIGNIWRFPAVLGQNGGGAYLVPFLLAIFLCALPLMVLELAMGRHYRGTVITAFRSVRRELEVVGWLLFGVNLLVLAYYLVITGWTLGYFLFSLTGAEISFSGFTGGWLPVAAFGATTAITGAVVSRGVRDGIERVAALTIPVSLAILVLLALYGATLPGFSEGMAFLFSPDFSVLGNPLIWSAAFGQAFFSLSVGTGILLTYGAYVGRDQGLPVSSLVITAADVAVALLAGVVIFPIVFSLSLVPTAGAELAFTTLPAAFDLLPAGWLIGPAFFLVLFFAALTSSVSMLEVGVAAVRESVGWSRARSAAVLTGALLVIGLPPALSYSPADLRVDGVRVLDLMDETVGTLGLPVTALLMAIAFTWFLSREPLSGEIGPRAARVVYPVCRFLIPGVLIVTTAARLWSGVDFPFLRSLPETEFIGTLLQVEVVAGTLIVILALILAGDRFWRLRSGGPLRERDRDAPDSDSRRGRRPPER